MINLFEFYHQESKDLHHSLLVSGFDHPTIVIYDDGFLPENVVSPYSYFMGEESGKPRYFNQIEVPKYWEIAGNGNFGEVFEKENRRAEIVYAEPKQERFVKDVKWFDLENRTRLVDHYNKYGRRFAQTVYNLENEAVFTSYFKTDGSEVIVENYVTKDIILNIDQQVKIFHSKKEFTAFYLTYANYNLDRMIYNSLSLPFMISYQLELEGSDILFWQEKERADIPGNMQLILDGKARRTQQVVVQNANAYKNLEALATNEQKTRLSSLGYLYPFSQANPNTKNCFVLTNSDQLEEIDALITRLPDVTIHIGALTEMSPKLMEKERYPNVRLHPQISPKKINELLKTSSIYLDINYHSEVLSIVRKAFEHNILIFGFESTVHNRLVTSPEFTYPKEQVSTMIEKIREALFGQKLPKLLDRQKQDANYSSVGKYQKLLGEKTTDPTFRFKVKNIDETLDFVLANQSSVVRFGDGEMDIIAGRSIPYQLYNEELAQKLAHIMGQSSSAKRVICLSDIFENRERYNRSANLFWKGHLEQFSDKYRELCQADWYGSTFISRPYIDLVDKSFSASYFEKLKGLWQGRDILIVEGKTSRSGVGNDLFESVRSVKRIICPSKDSYERLEDIKREIEKYAEDRLVLLMLGPTAKVIAYELSQKHYQCIDIGHIDSEYEWFKMGATHKVKLSTKHTAEYNYDQDIEFEESDQYNQQIVVDLS